jgi:serine/threonine-protein kinase
MKQTWKGKWNIGDRIGKGGQGLTYLASRDSESEYEFAIKFLKEQKNLERRERMYVEISALNILNHPNIPKLQDHNSEYYQDLDFEMYMVSDYIYGSTLQEFIEKNGVLDLNRTLLICIKLADVLSYCHNKGFIHRDIKPDNIILEKDNPENPILIDFGLSFNVDIERDKSLTPSWQHIGNRFLSLPELRISDSNKRDYRSDVTMLCGIIFFCLTGIHPTDLLDEKSSKPHRRETSIAILEKIGIDRLTILNNIFDIGFNFSINDRWQSIESLRSALIDLQNFNMEENQLDDINSQLERFKKRIEERLDYKQSENLQQIFGTCSKVIGASANDVKMKLSPTEFSTVQSGHKIDYSKQLFTNMLGLKHPYDEKIFFFPKFSMYITGSEVVLEGIEDNNRTELLRTSLNEKIDWLELRVKIANYYMTGLIGKDK